MSEHWKVIDGSWPEVFHVPGDNGARYPYSNALLVKTSKDNNAALMIDCGVGARIARKIRKEFNVTSIILSHWHEDHTVSSKTIRSARIYCHPADIPPLSDPVAFMRNYGVLGNEIEQQFTAFMESIGVEPLQGVQPLIPGPFQDGDAALQVIHTPGHSAGHCCYYEPGRKIAFLSDIDLSKFGPWYGCLDSSLEDFVQSIRKIQSLNIDIAVPSHEGIKEGKAIKDGLDYFLGKIEERNDKVLTMLRERSPLLARDLYGRNIVYRNYDKFGDYLRHAEAIMVDLHVQYLLDAGKVARIGEAYTLA
ncbi:MAG: MBL fold metallo-hydrolase [Candidatus Lokiarchaeota archaeon]|nr:MBL fold metallo-hydrolase [Candidatus Lokiarchaeota archaeon]